MSVGALPSRVRCDAMRYTERERVRHVCMYVCTCVRMCVRMYVERICIGIYVRCPLTVGEGYAKRSEARRGAHASEEASQSVSQEVGRNYSDRHDRRAKTQNTHQHANTRTRTTHIPWMASQRGTLFCRFKTSQVGNVVCTSHHTAHQHIHASRHSPSE